MQEIPVEGIQYYKRIPHLNRYWNRGVYSSIINVYYKGKLLDYIFESIMSGPNGEKYIAGIRSRELDDERLPMDVSEENWTWYDSVEDAAQFIWTREFSAKL